MRTAPALALTLALAGLGCASDDDEAARAAVDAYNAGRAAEALPRLEEQVARRPDDPALRLYLGLACRETGKVGLALEHAGRAVELSPDNGRARALRSDLLRAAGRFDEAVADAREAARLLPSDGAAWNNLGLALAAAGKLEEALRAYDRALRADPADPVPHYNQGEVYRRMRQLPSAERSLEQALKLAPGNGFALFALAECEFSQGSFAEARLHYGAILALAQPELADRRGRVLFQLGRCFLAERDPESAWRSFDQAGEAGYEARRVAQWKAKVLYDREKPREALALLEQIPQSTWGDMPEVAYDVGLCQYDLGDFEGALQSFQQALDAKLPAPPILTRMGLAFVRQFEGLDPERRSAAAPALLKKAKELFARALAVDPDHVDALMGSAKAEFKSGAPAAALRLAEKVLVLKPDHAPAWLLKGLCLYDQGKVAEALPDLRRYVGAHPAATRVVVFLAQVVAELGRLAEAEALFQRALAASPGDWDAQLMLSSVLTQQGKFVPAAALLQRILAGADDPDVLAEARHLYELITRPFRAVLFPAAPRAVVPGSLDYLKGKLEEPQKLRERLLDKPDDAEARAKLQDILRGLIVDYTTLRRKRLFLDETDRLFYKNEIRKLIEFCKGGS